MACSFSPSLNTHGPITGQQKQNWNSNNNLLINLEDLVLWENLEPRPCRSLGQYGKVSIWDFLVKTLTPG